MAIVNGFDTEKIRAQLQRVKGYLIYKSNNDYYIIDGVMILRCNQDVINKLQSAIEIKLPENEHGYKYDEKDGWKPSDFENLSKFLRIAQEGHHTYGPNETMNVKDIKRIQYGFDKPFGNYGKDYKPCTVCTLENDDKVLLNRRYTDMMTYSKKWGWFAEGKDRLSAVHFMNKENRFEMWVLPIRYQEGCLDEY